VRDDEVMIADHNSLARTALGIGAITLGVALLVTGKKRRILYPIFTPISMAFADTPSPHRAFGVDVETADTGYPFFPTRSEASVLIPVETGVNRSGDPQTIIFTVYVDGVEVHSVTRRLPQPGTHTFVVPPGKVRSGRWAQFVAVNEFTGGGWQIWYLLP
jgi:hypothetical protein